MRYNEKNILGYYLKRRINALEEYMSYDPSLWSSWPLEVWWFPLHLDPPQEAGHSHPTPAPVQPQSHQQHPWRGLTLLTTALCGVNL